MRGVLIFALLLVATPTRAEPVEVTDPVTILPAGHLELDLADTHFMLDRPAMNQCNADAALVEKRDQQVIDLSLALADARKPEAGWKISLRWASIGLAVGAAFVAGMWVAP